MLRLKNEDITSEHHWCLLAPEIWASRPVMDGTLLCEQPFIGLTHTHVHTCCQGKPAYMTCVNVKLSVLLIENQHSWLVDPEAWLTPLHSSPASHVHLRELQLIQSLQEH